MSVSFSDMNPALRLESTYSTVSKLGTVIVHIEESKFSALAAAQSTKVSGLTAASVKSLSLFLTREDGTGQPLSLTLNGHECTYIDDNIRRMRPEVSITGLPEEPTKYNVSFEMSWGSAGYIVITDSHTHFGDMITPVITEITQGSTPGSSLKLKISPNSYEGLSAIITGVPGEATASGILSKVIITKDGVRVSPEKDYSHDGIYEVTGLTTGKEHAFVVHMKSTQGFMSEYSAVARGTPVLTVTGPAATTTNKTKGDYTVSFPAFTRAALSNATVAEQEKDQMKFAELYEYKHEANELNASSAVVAEHMFTKVHTVQSVIHSDGSSSFPFTEVYFEGPHHGKHVRHHWKVTNGHGRGDKGTEGKTTVLSATVSKPAVSCSSLGGKKYQIAVQAGAVIPGYTLIAYKVTTTQAGAFSELNGATDILGGSTTTEVYLDAIEKVTSSNVLNQADIVSFKTVSKVNFLLSGSAAFAVSAVGIYEITTQLKQLLPLGSEVSGADLRLADGTVVDRKQKLVYGPADKVFADAGAANKILDGDKQSAAATTESIVPVADITNAAWTPVPAAEFVSASGDNATYKMSMTKFTISGVTENGVACSYATHTVKHSILKKNKYSEYEEIRLFYGSDLDQAKVSAQFDVPCGQRSLVGVQVSVYNQLGKLIAQSPIVDAAEALIPSGDGAYSGLTVMSHGDQGAVAYPEANTEGADFKWVLNRAATGFAADKCRVRIAFETSTRQLVAGVDTHYPTKDARMNDPEFKDANWVKDTRIYKLDEEGKATGANIVDGYVPDHKEFAELGKPIRGFNVYTLPTDLNAMESYSFKVHRDWKKLISGSVANNNAVYEKLTDTKPITVTITPTIAVQPPLVAYVASDGALTSSFEKDTAATEVNQAAQLTAINKQGGILNAVLVKKDGKYEQIDQSSSAHFTSAIENGTYTIASRAQYLSPNFGKPYSADTQYVMSARTSDSSQKFGPGPAQLDASVVSAIDTHVLTSASNHGCLFTWPELASNCTVIIRAVFNDPTDANADAYAELATGLLGTQKFIKHADVMTSTQAIANLGITAAQYYKHGVEFLVVQKHIDDSVTPNIVTYSQPKALFHMPKGLTTFAAGDFGVTSGSSKLTIKYIKTDDADVYPDFAGNSIVPATITYTGDNVTREIKVADITSANGIVISGLSDLHAYSISIAIDGQVGADGKPAPIALAGTYSPAALPNAVANLKVAQVVNQAAKLTVTFDASTKNGEYSAVAYKAYVSTMVNGVMRYLSAATGALAAVSAGKVGFTFASGAELSGLTTGALYNVEIESTFSLAGHSNQLVSAFASNTACAAPTMNDFRFDSKNNAARLVVNLNGAKLNTLLLLGNNGSVTNIDLANAAVAQSKLGQIALNIAVPAGASNVAVIVANSQGVALSAAQNAQGAAAVVTDATKYNAVTEWINL